MTTAVVQPTSRRAIARPLATLVPLIQAELAQGDAAGREHYRRAGELLLEAGESHQATGARWTAWLSRNFKLSRWTAYQYMGYAEGIASGRVPRHTSMRAATGRTDTDRARQKKIRDLFDEVADVDVDHLAQERQTVADEVKLHRDLALELIDLGFKALATRLHPDKGGSKDAMGRLNRVRMELRDVATTRRFV